MMFSYVTGKDKGLHLHPCFNCHADRWLLKARMKAYADFNDYQIVGEYEDARAKKQAIEADKITGDNIYKVLVCFEKLYNVMNPLERKKLMEHLISEIQIYPERQPNGQWLKSIKFRLPIVESDIDLCLDNESHTEVVSCYT